MRQQDVFASTQILTFNPIREESCEIQMQYYSYLLKLIRLLKLENASTQKLRSNFTKKHFAATKIPPRTIRENTIPTRMCYLIPFDLALMLAFRSKLLRADKIKVLTREIISDFRLPYTAADFLHREFDAALGDVNAWNDVLSSNTVKGFEQYLKLLKENVLFLKESAYSILITATMSAGKSTLINALVGKNICRMQNMACTNKIHTIISKPFDDGVTSEYDHELLMDASREELHSNNEENRTSKISVGTFFNSTLGGERIVVYDSPGVNSSVNEDHREISHKMLRSKKYALLLYVINATQFESTDETKHLNVVKKAIGRTANAKIKVDH